MMSNSKRIFLTGATGLLGSYLLKLFLQNGYYVYVLARSKNNQAAQDRIFDILKFWDEHILDNNCLNNLKVVEGDIVYPRLGIKAKNDIDELISQVELIFHSAALADITIPLEPIRKINVEGTRNLLDFALECKKSGRLQKVNHISTSYVIGTKKDCDFSEDMLDVGQGFHNTYEQTKYEAEILVREYLGKGLNISIFRPSMIIGDSKEGKSTDFRLFYTPLRFFSQEIFSEFPADMDCCQNVINVDTVANAILLLGEKAEEKVYHLVSPACESIGFLLDLASDYFGFSLPNFVPADKFDIRKLTPVQRIMAEPYMPYFNYTARFISDQTQRVLAGYNFIWPAINKENLTKSLSYCEKRRFIKKRR